MGKGAEGQAFTLGGNPPPHWACTSDETQKSEHGQHVDMSEPAGAALCTAMANTELAAIADSGAKPQHVLSCRRADSQSVVIVSKVKAEEFEDQHAPQTVNPTS